MHPLLTWLLAYVTPMAAMLLIARTRKSSVEQVAIANVAVLVSALALVFLGVSIPFSISSGSFTVFAIALCLTFFFLRGFGVLYALSCVAQESYILLAGTLIIPVVGLLPATILTAGVFALAHLVNPKGWRWFVPLTFIWGMTTIFLYVWLEQPLLNVALHLIAGGALFHFGLLGNAGLNKTRSV